MRSRTSRGVLEWSGGKELYIGSGISAIGKVSGSPGIVPGPPEGSRGSTGWGHLSRRAPWAEVGGEPAPSGLVRPPGPPLRLGLETLGGGAHHLPWGALHPPWPPPPWEIGSPRAGAPPGGLYKGRGERGSRTLKSWRPLPLLHLFLLRHVLGEALPECCCSTTTTPLCCCWSHHHQPLLPPCWIKTEETLR